MRMTHMNKTISYTKLYIKPNIGIVFGTGSDYLYNKYPQKLSKCYEIHFQTC